MIDKIFIMFLIILDSRNRIDSINPPILSRDLVQGQIRTPKRRRIRRKACFSNIIGNVKRSNHIERRITPSKIADRVLIIFTRSDKKANKKFFDSLGTGKLQLSTISNKLTNGNVILILHKPFSGLNFLKLKRNLTRRRRFREPSLFNNKKFDFSATIVHTCIVKGGKSRGTFEKSGFSAACRRETDGGSSLASAQFIARGIYGGIGKRKKGKIKKRRRRKREKMERKIPLGESLAKQSHTTVRRGTVITLFSHKI